MKGFRVGQAALAPAGPGHPGRGDPRPCPNARAPAGVREPRRRAAARGPGRQSRRAGRSGASSSDRSSTLCPGSPSTRTIPGVRGPPVGKQLTLEILSRARPVQPGTSRCSCSGAFRQRREDARFRLREWRARLVTQRIAEDVRLARLDRDETALMTTLILDTGLPAPRDVAEAIYARTDGVPLHVEELLGALNGDAMDGGAIHAAVPASLEDATSSASPGCRRRRRRWPAPGPSSVAGSCRRSLPGSWTCRSTRSDEPIQELVDHDVLDGPGCAGCTTFGTSSCAMRSIGRCRPETAAGSTPGRPSSEPGWRAPRGSTLRSTTSKPACMTRRSAPRSAGRGPPSGCRPPGGIRVVSTGGGQHAS